jgi:hypothetical protein
MGYKEVSWAGAVAVAISNDFRHPQWTRTRDLKEEGDGFDEWLDDVEELLNGTGADFKTST